MSRFLERLESGGVIVADGAMGTVLEGRVARLRCAAQIGCLFLAVLAASAADSFPGKRSRWFGFERFDFEVEGKPVLVVVPHSVAPGRPWAWHGEFFGHKPNPDLALLGRGFHIVYASIPDRLGAPAMCVSEPAAHCVRLTSEDCARACLALANEHLGERPVTAAILRAALCTMSVSV